MVGEFLSGVTVVKRPEFFSEELFWQGIMFDGKATESISYQIRFAFQPLDIRGVFFKEESPSHDPICIEMFVGKIFMVCVNGELLTKEDGLKLFAYLNNGEEFFFCCVITCLSRIEFLLQNAMGLFPC